MRKIVSLLVMPFLIGVSLKAQTAIDVAENTLKVSPASEEVFYFGFAEGDQVIFSFEEVNGKELKELEIIAMPSSSVFMDYKTKRIENKTLNIAQTGIYKFRFANSNILAGRVCKFKIQRIPGSEATRKFNTNVYKRILYDTSYYESYEKYLERTDTTISELLNQVAKVHSSMNLNGSKTTFNFQLPPNTVSWSYYIGVDQDGQQAYEAASKQVLSKPSTFIKLAGYSPLAAVALGAACYIPQLQAGEDIDYYIVTGGNANLFMAGKQFYYEKRGKVINDYAKMEPLKGDLHFCFSNDNAITGVSVLVRVTAIQVHEVWNTRPVKRMKVNNREELYLKTN